MSSSVDTQRSLGIGGITADALSIYFQRFGLMFTLSLIPAIISLLITGAVPQVSSFEAANNPAAAGWPIFFATLGAFLAATLSNALIVLAAFDTKVGRPVRIGVYVQRAVANLLTIVILTIAMGLIIGIPVVILAVVLGFVLSAVIGGIVGAIAVGITLIVCILYFAAAFSPFVPAIVIEGVGFGALGRAWRLTADYRWPVAGALLVFFIILAVIQFVGGLLARVLASVEPSFLPIIVALATGAIAGGVMAVGVAMIYARLRAIKEGLDIESLADVFS